MANLTRIVGKYYFFAGNLYLNNINLLKIFFEKLFKKVDKGN